MLNYRFTGLLLTKSQTCRTIFIIFSISLLLVAKTGLDKHFFQIFKSRMSLMDNRLHFRAEGGRHCDSLVLQKNTFMVGNFTAVGVIRKNFLRYLMFLCPTSNTVFKTF